MRILLIEPSTKLREAICTSLITTGGFGVDSLSEFPTQTFPVSKQKPYDFVLVNTIKTPKNNDISDDYHHLLFYKILVSKITELKPVKTSLQNGWILELSLSQLPALSQVLLEISLDPTWSNRHFNS